METRHSSIATPVSVSLDWLRENKAVPVCGGTFRNEWRAVHSLSESRAERIALPDGSVRIQIPALAKAGQFAAAVVACAAAGAAAFVPVGLVRQSPAGFWAVVAAGAVIGAFVAPRVIRRHPTVLLTWSPRENQLIADRGNVCVAHSDIESLLLVIGREALTLPEHSGATTNDWAAEYGALLMRRRSAPANEAELIFRYALPVAAITSAAQLAKETLAVPLEVWDFSISD